MPNPINAFRQSTFESCSMRKSTELCLCSASDGGSANFVVPASSASSADMICGTSSLSKVA
jgi:hypothetical protein